MKQRLKSLIVSVWSSQGKDNVMIIKYQALSSLLQKKLHPLYVLIGNEPYLLNDAADQIKQSFRKLPDCSQTIIDIQSTSDWSFLIAEANSYSLFSEHVLLDARFDKKSIDATGKSLLTDYLTSVNEKCLILLRAPLLSSKSLQWLIDSQFAVVIQISPLTAIALKQWIDKQLQARGFQAEPAVINLIQQYTHGNMLATAQLLDKLSLCSNTPRTSVSPITIEMVHEHLSDQSHFEIYELAEACLDGNTDLTLRLLRQFRLERIEPTFILWVLTQEVRQLIQLHYLLKQPISIDTACNQLKIWSSRVKYYAKANARLSLQVLLRLLNECQQLDEMIKTTQNMQIWDKFDLISLSMCGQSSKMK